MMRGWALALLLLSVLGSARARADGEPLRRFLLTVAANDGGPRRAPLQYAERDARAVREVLAQLGGVEPGDVHALVQPDASALGAAFAALVTKLREAAARGARTEVVFYYSGHSDESGVLLGTERVAYAELRRRLEELPADVRIAILDSCASGAFTRSKGGVRRAPFLLDASTQVRGHAFLTSSSADEAAQESDRIGGSFFTHALVSGMRGAADASGDSKITLTEAYRFAFEETLQRTSQTQFGSQHPAYEIRLAGTGDLVMTDLRATSAELTIEAPVEGRVFVWSARRALLVEVYKPRGRRLVLAVPPGAYRLELTRGSQFFAADARATVGASAAVPESAFHEVGRETTLARGLLEPFTVRPLAASLIPPFSTNARAGVRPVMNHLDFALLYDDPDAVEGLQLGLFGVRARRYVAGLQLGLFFNDASALRGLQLGAFANVTRALAEGAQIAAGFSHVAGEMVGLQLAGLSAHTRVLTGAQLSLGLTLTRERARGAQLGAISWARSLHGVQLGGVNLARDLRGLQLGGLNVAAGRVRGLQIGLINFAEEADVSLGVLGMTREGGAHAQLALTDVAAPELSLRLDAKYNYSFVRAALAPYGAGRAYLLGAGLGAKVPLVAALWLDVELGFHLVQPWAGWVRGMRDTLSQLRLLARYELHKHFSLFAGPTLSVRFQRSSRDPLAPALGLAQHALIDETKADGSVTRLLLWPGFALGIRL